MSIYWREALKKSIWEQHPEIIPGTFLASFWLFVVVANWNFVGLRGDFPYCKRFVLASTKREPNKQSLWEK